MNSRLNFRLFIATSGFMKHLILVSIKPAAAQTAAHRNLPFGTHVRVTDLKNSKSVVVRITDRGP
ncbi:hypothetical protein ABIB94_008859 [Bradyrhizobium sp. JR7.2]